jgi:hypothetical protein
VINDSSTSATDLWSASKISTELAGKSNTGHTHVEEDITDLDKFWVKTGNDIYYNTGTVAVGTNTPTSSRVKIVGYGTGSQTPWLELDGGGGTDSGAIHYYLSGETNGPAIKLRDFDDPSIIEFQQVGSGTVTSPQYNVWFGMDGQLTTDMRLEGGNFGIGKSPTETLDVQGSIGVTGTVDGRDIAADGTTLDEHVGNVFIHRQINDGGISVTDLWSASKIIDELSGKSPQVHTHAASDVVSGTFDDDRISSSSVTQHSGALEAILDHNNLVNYDVAEHRTINDSAFGSTNLWSASKINSELSGKADLSHTHDASDISSGTFANDRISSGSITQHTADIDHNNLNNLTSGDPHTQYAYLPGRNGGQTLIGDTAASGNLILQSTTNGTKGFIKCSDPVIANDEGFATSYALSVQRNSDYSYIEILNNGGADKGAFFGMELNQFSLYNWQGGDIEFWVDPSPSAGSVKFTMQRTGELRIHDLSSGVVKSSATGVLSSEATGTAFNKNFGSTSGTVAEGDHAHPASDIVSGTFADARISESSVTQHATALEGALNHDDLVGFVGNEHIDHSAVSILAGQGLSGGGTIAATRTINLDINSLDPAAAPDGAADYVVVYDTSAGSHKKVLLDNLPTNFSGGNMGSLEIKRSLTFEPNATYQDVTFNITSVENDITILKHDDVNTERVLINESGLYLLLGRISVSTTNSSYTKARFRKNGTDMLCGEFGLDPGSTSSEDGMFQQILVNLNAADYVTLQIKDSGSEPGIINNAVISLVRLAGPKGDPGENGLAWQGAWTSATSYEVFDAVQNDGTAYIATAAHTSGASSEPGIGSSWESFWDILASAAGAVIGPNSATNNAVARFDGTTGELVKNSVVAIDDSGVLTGASIDVDTNTITNIDDAAIKTGAGINATKISDGSISNTEFGYLNGVTSDIQTQLNGKAATSHNHAASDVTSGSFADDRISESSVTQHSTALEAIIDHNNLVNYSVDEHRTINDSGSATTDLWSASKISSELSGKAATSHTHAASDITSGTFINARISESSVTQHATALETALNHDNLAGFVANEHINHASVSINAGEGLSGGGTIASTRTIDLDINGLTVDGSPDTSADYVVTYDSSAGSHKKVLIDDVLGDQSKVIRQGHTWAIAGEVRVASGDTDFLMPFFVSLANGQTAKIVSCRYKINSGTSATVNVQRNGSNVSGLTGLNVSTTANTTTPTSIDLSENDQLSLVITSVNGTPKNLSFTIFIEHTV